MECDMDSGVCMPKTPDCITHEECADGEVCFDGACNRGTLCNMDEDCVIGDSCDLVQGFCIDDITCVTLSANYELCPPSDKLCVVKEDCRTFWDCKEGKCVESSECLLNEDCNSGEVCFISECRVGTECTQEFECLKESSCDTQQGFCVENEPCVLSTQNYEPCEPDPDPCLTDEDCKEGISCNIEEGKCGLVDMNCINHRDCSSGMECLEITDGGSQGAADKDPTGERDDLLYDQEMEAYYYVEGGIKYYLDEESDSYYYYDEVDEEWYYV